MPLPKADYIVSKKYLFRNEGYVKEPAATVNNNYVEYINTAVGSERNKDFD